MTRSNSTATSRFLPQPIDRVALVLIVTLCLLIGILLLSGDHAAARVRDFSWQGKQVGTDDTAFTLTFSRPMDHASVETNLRIDPPLSGKISWAGRRMAYTLNTPAPYGTQFQVHLQKAHDRFTNKRTDGERATIQPFVGQFQSRDRTFAYIGVAGEEAGRLVLFNLNQQQKQILTPKDLVVMEFQTYPLSDRLLFAATQRTTQPVALTEQQLFTVTTGIQVRSPVQLEAQPSPTVPSAELGKVALVLDNKEYQNLKFDLSADGKIIVVQRVSRKNPSDFGPWLLRQDEPPQPLKGDPGGDFLITPDSNSLAIAQGQGLAILPLQPNAKPLDFLPKFGMVLSFAKDGSLATMVKFNTDNTRSLFLVGNQGVGNQGTQKELFRTTGSIFSAQFDPAKQTLYCLLTELLAGGDVYREQPYLAAIDLKTAKLLPLLLLPDQRDIQVSLAPDGLALLFDQTTDAVQGKTETDTIRDSTGKAIAASRLWLLPLDLINSTAKLKPEVLPLPGLRPLWLP